MSIDEKTKNVLRGQKFISKTETVTVDGERTEIERICKNCYFGTIPNENGEIKPIDNCLNRTALVLFNKSPLYSKLDKKDVAKYCSCFQYHYNK